MLHHSPSCSTTLLHVPPCSITPHHALPRSIILHHAFMLHYMAICSFVLHHGPWAPFTGEHGMETWRPCGSSCPSHWSGARRTKPRVVTVAWKHGSPIWTLCSSLASLSPLLHTGPLLLLEHSPSPEPPTPPHTPAPLPTSTYSPGTCAEGRSLLLSCQVLAARGLQWPTVNPAWLLARPLPHRTLRSRRVAWPLSFTCVPGTAPGAEPWTLSE